MIGFSQINSCNSKVNSDQVIEIAKKQNAYWIGDGFAQPKITFEEQKCIWIVTSIKYSHTNKGNCKYTNGCTLTKTLTLIIDAKTSIIISKNIKKKSYPNYE